MSNKQYMKNKLIKDMYNRITFDDIDIITDLLDGGFINDYHQYIRTFVCEYTKEFDNTEYISELCDLLETEILGG